MSTPIIINIDGNEMHVSYGLATAWFNLNNSTVNERIIEFLDFVGIQKQENKRVAAINESNEVLIQENKELKSLLAESLELNNKINNNFKQLNEMFLYLLAKKK